MGPELTTSHEPGEERQGASAAVTTAAAGASTELLLLLDHANLDFEHVRLSEILELWLTSLVERRLIPSTGVPTMRVRAYGGWYLGEGVSEARFEAAEFYQRECPSLFKHESLYCRVRFEFADSLLESERIHPPEESPIKITHTVGTRTQPPRIWPRANAPACGEPTCQLRAVRRWTRRGRACTLETCPLTFGDCFGRFEQKQVDVHLAADLLGGAVGGPHLAVATDDVDFLPALLSCALRAPAPRSLTLIRSATARSYMDSRLSALGVGILRLPAAS